MKAKLAAVICSICVLGAHAPAYAGGNGDILKKVFIDAYSQQAREKADETGDDDDEQKAEASEQAAKAVDRMPQLKACLNQCTGDFRSRIPPGRSMRCVDEGTCRACTSSCQQEFNQ